MKIVSIEEGVTFSGGRYSYEGYVIKLDDGSVIKVGIDDCQNCCEVWGYLTSSDKVQDFVGAEFKGINVVEEGGEEVKKSLKEGSLEYSSAMFVNIDTSEGKLQLVCYNEHNGYYSHEAVVIVADEVIESQYL